MASKKMIKVDCAYWVESTLPPDGCYALGYCNWKSKTVRIPNSMLEWDIVDKMRRAMPPKHRLVDAHNCKGCKCKKEK